MSDKFVEFNPNDLEKFLQDKGFVRTLTKNEVVYIFNHQKMPKLKVKVYTTIKVGDGEIRECGDDAIRIAAVFEDGDRSFGIGKFPRIYRTAPSHMSQEEKQKHLFDRVLTRTREAYARCNEWRNEQRNKYYGNSKNN